MESKYIKVHKQGDYRFEYDALSHTVTVYRTQKDVEGQIHYAKLLTTGYEFTNTETVLQSMVRDLFFGGGK